MENDMPEGGREGGRVLDFGGGKLSFEWNPMGEVGECLGKSAPGGEACSSNTVRLEKVSPGGRQNPIPPPLQPFSIRAFVECQAVWGRGPRIQDSALLYFTFLFPAIPGFYLRLCRQ